MSEKSAANTQRTTKQRKEIPCTYLDSNPKSHEKKSMQTYTLNRSATEIGVANMELFYCICAD
jgi:hypothetical protein